MDTTRNKKSFCILSIPILIACAIIIICYIIGPLLFSWDIKNTNFEMFGAILNATVVIVLYIITYKYVDSRQIKKDDNAISTARILLLSAYRECVSTLIIVDNKEWI